jgi:hypothetical protein
MALGDVQVVEIPCGKGGMNYSKAVIDFPIEDLRDSENCTFEHGTWEKEGGATKINTTVITDAPTITGLHDFWPDSVTQKRIAGTSDGKIISFGTDGIIDTLKSGLGTDKQFTFAESLGASTTRKLFCFNGYNAPQVTSDGVSCANLATPPADWTGNNQPTVGIAHRNRMWAFGNANAKHRLGEKLVAGISMFGRLFLFKYPTGIYWIDDSDTTASNWTANRLSKAIGMKGPLGLAQTQNDTLFISADGFVHSLLTVEAYGDAKSSAILPDKIGEFVRTKIKNSRLEWAVACYYSFKQEWHLAHTAQGSTANDQRLILDLSDLGNPRYRYSPRDECEAMSLVRDSNGIDRPMVGDTVGFVRMLDQSNRNKDGGAYIAKFNTADIPLMQRGLRRGNLQWVEAIFRPEGQHNLTLDVYKDSEYSETVYMSMGGASGAALGSFVLGTSSLGGGNIANTRKRLTGDCRRISLVGYNSGINENFSISSFLIGFTPGNERI